MEPVLVIHTTASDCLHDFLPTSTKTHPDFQCGRCGAFPNQWEYITLTAGLFGAGPDGPEPEVIEGDWHEIVPPERRLSSPE